jgi:enoyl-CoA hydratase/carnithine racemase
VATPPAGSTGRHTRPETLQVAIDGAIATITLSRPDRLNAFTDEMEQELIDALDLLDADDAVRCVILTGQGRAFCAGMDISAGGDSLAGWRSSATAPPGTQFDVPGQDLPIRRDGGGRVVLRMYASNTPIIAAINGPAVGVGATLVLAADLRLAADDARLGFVFGRRGVVPESCSSWFLPRLVGMQTAMEWVLTGRLIGAQEALAKGLLRSVHPAAELLDAAYGLAREITDNTAPVSTALARQLLWRMQGARHPMAAHHAETLALNLRGVSADAREGFAAFVEGRTPVFEDAVSRDLPAVFVPDPADTFDPHVLGVARG